MAMGIRLDHVTLFYDTRLVFQEVTLDLPAGSITLLAGPNGAGKTSLLHIAAGLLSPTSGTVTKNNSEDSVALLGHQTFLYPELTALENLHFWLKMHGNNLPEKILMETLERVGLHLFADEKSSTFSRGMAQRLSLARVFLLAPKLLLLDEPGTGLDTQSLQMLHKEIVSARNRGACIVWISHSLDTDAVAADYLAYLDNRKLAYFGPPSSFSLPVSCSNPASTIGPFHERDLAC